MAQAIPVTDYPTLHDFLVAYSPTAREVNSKHLHPGDIVLIPQPDSSAMGSPVVASINIIHRVAIHRQTVECYWRTAAAGGGEDAFDHERKFIAPTTTMLLLGHTDADSPAEADGMQADLENTLALTGLECASFNPRRYHPGDDVPYDLIIATDNLRYLIGHMWGGMQDPARTFLRIVNPQAKPLSS